MNDGGGPASPRGLTRDDVFALLGGLGSILTLVTAVLFYFGWRRSFEQANAMSLDVSLFGFSFQDYVQRGISSLYLPLLVVFGLALGCLWLHAHVSSWLRSDVPAPRRRHRTTVASIVWAAGTVLAVSCVVFILAAGLSDPPWLIARLAERLRRQQWVVSLLLVLATLTSAYAGWVRRQLQHSSDTAALTTWQRVLSVVLIAGIVILGVVWMLEQYATAVGRGKARELVDGVDRLPRAVVLSPTPLGIEAPGIEEEQLGAAASPTVRYRITGLRLLARSGGKVLLVHDGWNPDTGTVIVLADSDDLAWQFSG